jgi:hypothetical protein
MDEFKHHFVQTNGIRMHVHETGAGHTKASRFKPTLSAWTSSGGGSSWQGFPLRLPA